MIENIWLIFAPFGVAIGFVIGWYAQKTKKELKAIKEL